MKRLILLGTMLWARACLPQDLPVNTSQQLENLAAVTDREPDEQLLLQMENWRRKPLNLNEATAEDLQLFPFLSALQVAHLLRYRSLVGPLTDLHELQAVPGWDLATIRQMLPYVRVAQAEPEWRRWQQTFKSGEHMVLLRTGRTVQKAAGFNRGAGGFVGDPYQLQARYIFRSQQGLQFGITAEKDAGEAFLQRGRATPDFLSPHMFIRSKHAVRALAVGDFTVNMGQGLIHWQGLAFGKSPEVLNIKRQGPVLRPYASAGEFQFLRGVGVTAMKHAWTATIFTARQRIHANIGRDEAGGAVITSFNPGGLHRTASEYADRKAATQWTAGGTVQYRHRSLQVGVNGVHQGFDVPIQKRDEPHNLYAPSGKRLFNISADYSFTTGNLHLFGEAATDYKGRPAAVQGALLSAHPALDLSLLARYLHKGYTAINANAFTEAGTATNEQGVYLGLQWRPAVQVRINAYADLHRSPWLRFRVDAPGFGADYLIQVFWRPAKTSEGYLLFRNEQKTANGVGEGQHFHLPAQVARQSVRVQWSKMVNKFWEVRSRAEWVQVQPASGPKSHGFLCLTDMQYRSAARSGLDFRLAFFETTGFESRIFAYEHDVLFSYSIPALYGKGLRSYATLKWRMTKSSSLWFRVAHTAYADQQTISSGLMEIAGNKRTDVRLQLVANL